MRTYEVVIIGGRPFVHNDMLVQVEKENEQLRARLAEAEKENERLSYNMSVFVKAYRTTKKRLAEVEAQRDGLAVALQKIADGRGSIPDKSTIFMNGKVPEVPKVFNHYDMRDIAREALAKLEEK